MFAASKSGKASGGGPGPVTTDPYFPYVPLLLETTSTNGQNNQGTTTTNGFLDSGTANGGVGFTITRNGTPTQGSVTPYWPNGQWSNYFGSSGNYLTGTSSSAMAMGAGDFTVECWLNLSAVTVNFGVVLELRASSATTTGFVINLGQSGGGYILNFYTSGAGNPGSIVMPFNVWNHIAVVRSSGVIKLYSNGAVAASFSNANTYSDTPAPTIAFSTLYGGAASDITGYVSNLRVVKGTAVYTSAFTPPTTPLTAITNTSLLTCQSNRFRDNSTNNFTITPSGTPTVQAFQPFSPAAAYTTALYGGSGYFNGSTDWLSVSPNTSGVLNFGTSPYTIEFWFYGLVKTANQMILRAQNATGSLQIYIDTSGIINFGPQNSAVTITVPSANWNINTWNHIAFSRVGTGSNQLTVYVNGASIASATDSFNYTITGIDIGAGTNFAGGYYLNGYLSNLRVVKGTAVYTGAFTPPTAPVTNITNTSLLLNFTNAGIYDATTQNVVSTVGDAQVSNTITAQFPPTSMKFDGTGDWLYMPSRSANSIRNSNFTIECWINISSFGIGNNPIYESRSVQGGSDGFTINAVSAITIQIFSSSSLILATVPNYSGVWTYIAVVRSGATTTLYVNGSSVGTTTGLGNLTNTDLIVGGGRYSTGSTISASFNGYIQDFRITNGVARTVTTVPTAPFPTR
jgi:hypothetical protein